MSGRERANATHMTKELPTSVVHYHSDRLAGVLGWSAFVPLLVFPSFSSTLGLAVATILASSGLYLRVIGERIEGALERREDELCITGVDGRSFPMKEVVSGYVVPEVSSADVVLELTGRRRVVARVPSAEDGDHLLAALGVDPAQRRTRIALGSPGRRIALGVLVTLISIVLTVMLFASLLYAAPAWLLWAITVGGLVGAPFGLMRATRPPVVTVGSDGVIIERSLGRRRFVALRSIASVERTRRGFELRLRDGGTVSVSGGFTGANQAAAARRIEAALDAFQAAEGEQDRRRAELLARNGRSVQGWREHVRSQIEREDYRRTGLRQEDAEAVLTRIDVPLEQRVGATLALTAHDRARAVEKVRVALEGTVDEQARVALEAALAEDDAAVDEALTAAARRR